MSQDIQKVSDMEIIEEAAKRLQKQFVCENGSPLLYGSFRFIFHDGRFQGVEDWPRNKRYQSPSRFNSSKKVTEEVG
ncbi:MAG TPA: hypothetical protein VF412_05385 [Bdellovibrio sp.]|uniref:hypothetical protein n=1 Tax=Bdellovibrio sp. TaxID=28201 RepID=UPI002F170D14